MTENAQGAKKSSNAKGKRNWVSRAFSSKRENKYNAQKTVVNGITFDSRKEARRYTDLLYLIKAGEIKDLERQKKFVLIPSQRGEDGKVIERECSYTADFCYMDAKTGERIVEDTKGYRTKDYIIKRKLMLHQYGIRIREV